MKKYLILIIYILAVCNVSLAKTQQELNDIASREAIEITYKADCQILDLERIFRSDKYFIKYLKKAEAAKRKEEMEYLKFLYPKPKNGSYLQAYGSSYPMQWYNQQTNFAKYSLEYFKNLTLAYCFNHQDRNDCIEYNKLLEKKYKK